MKIWYQHSSEHSANLVMIGHFEDAAKAKKAEMIIDTLTKHVCKEELDGNLIVGQPSERYGSEMLDFLLKLNVSSIGPRELEQFLYDVRVEVKESKIVVTTDEIEISAFLKVMLDHGARIEVYSAHNHPNSEYGR
jgi:hypothetical protein